MIAVFGETLLYKGEFVFQQPDSDIGSGDAESS
jgi:hypothetical protein